MRYLFQQGVAVLLSWCLLLVGVEDALAFQSDQSISQPAQTAQQSPEQLQQLVAAHRVVP
jgi:hypothetical protein